MPCFCGRPVSPTRRKYCSYPCQALGARLTQYGLDGWTFQQMVRSQCGACAICGKQLVFNAEIRAPAIDHDHATGEVRGVLCHSCNLRVGWFEHARKNGWSVLAQDLDGFATKIASYLKLD